MWRIGWAPNNANRWQMGFNAVFKGLIHISLLQLLILTICTYTTLNIITILFSPCCYTIKSVTKYFFYWIKCMIYEKRFKFSFIGFVFLQLLYINCYLIIQFNSNINYAFLNRVLYYKVWYVNPYLSLHYDHVPVLFFCIVDLYFFLKT
jgi:hypothetical protein